MIGFSLLGTTPSILQTSFSWNELDTAVYRLMEGLRHCSSGLCKTPKTSKLHICLFFMTCRTNLSSVFSQGQSYSSGYVLRLRLESMLGFMLDHPQQGHASLFDQKKEQVFWPNEPRPCPVFLMHKAYYRSGTKEYYYIVPQIGTYVPLVCYLQQLFQPAF